MHVRLLELNLVLSVSLAYCATQLYHFHGIGRCCQQTATAVGVVMAFAQIFRNILTPRPIEITDASNYVFSDIVICKGDKFSHVLHIVLELKWLFHEEVHCAFQCQLINGV